MSSVISVEHLTKTYRLGAIGGATLNEDLARWWARVRGKPDPLAKIGHEHHARRVGEQFWALDDLSFEVPEGELLGIIGRNGAGKSTLLKILSQVTSPTSGQIMLRRRVASLLEVGTGFHPDLTGRENIFLNGAILGMTKAEIRGKLDEIVSFSECETFVDTPVKRYSSGMFVRLAFAVAAHLEPEILIVDEVLAVGDAQFQKKCLGKMQDVGREGRTVLFVSHTMSAITRLCNRAMLLGGGKLLGYGSVHEIVAQYLDSGLGTTAAREWQDLADAPGNEVARLRGVWIRDEAGVLAPSVDIRRPVAIEVEFEVIKAGLPIIPNVHVHNSEGTCVFISHDWDPEWRHQPRPLGHWRRTCWIPGNLLAEGTFVVSASLGTYKPFIAHAWAPEAVGFEVIDTMQGDSSRGDYAGRLPGIVRPMLEWTSSRQGDAPPVRDQERTTAGVSGSGSDARIRRP